MKMLRILESPVMSLFPLCIPRKLLYFRAEGKHFKSKLLWIKSATHKQLWSLYIQGFSSSFEIPSKQDQTNCSWKTSFAWEVSCAFASRDPLNLSSNTLTFSSISLCVWYWIKWSRRRRRRRRGHQKQIRSLKDSLQKHLYTVDPYS